MIRARLSNGDFLFGIEAENVRRLRAGEKIRVSLAELGGPDQAVILMYGETIASMVDELERATGQVPDTFTKGAG